MILAPASIIAALLWGNLHALPTSVADGSHGTAAHNAEMARMQEQQAPPGVTPDGGSSAGDMSMSDMVHKDGTFSVTTDGVTSDVKVGSLTSDKKSVLKKVSAKKGGTWKKLPSFPKGTNAYHMIAFPGKVLLIAGSGNSVTTFKAGTFKAYIWKPGRSLRAIKVPDDMFCSGHTPDAYGHGRVVGGTTQYAVKGKLPWTGAYLNYDFNPATERFTKQDNMKKGRWYPDAIPLPSNMIAVMGGYDENGANSGTTELLDPRTGKTTLLPGKTVLPLYHQTYVTYNGKLFYTGIAWGAPNLHRPGFFDSINGKFTPVPGLVAPAYRAGGSSAWLGDVRKQKMVIMGGATPTSAITSAQIINLREKNPRFRNLPSLRSPKTYVASVGLPDETIFETNGGTRNDLRYASRETSILSADGKRWQHMNPAPTNSGRLYHNIAYLHDDGSVIVFGGNSASGHQPRNNTVYRFKPPYMYKSGPTPALGSLPRMQYGKSYKIPVKNAAYVWLTMPPTPTHESDPVQRGVKLPVKNGVITLSFTRNDIQAGNVRLFPVSGNGKPGIARWSRIS